MHAPFAADGGLHGDIIEAISTGADTRALMQADEKAVYDFAVATHERHGVDDGIYAEAHAQLGEAGVVDLIGLLGYYTMISMVLNCFEVPVPGGAKPLG